MILKSSLLQKGCDWLPVCAVVAAPSDSEEAVNICCSESSRPCCPTPISLPPQPGHTTASVQTERLGAQADLWTSVHVVRVQLKLNRQTLQAPRHLNLGRESSPRPPSICGQICRSPLAVALASRASSGTDWLITYCLHNSAGGPAGRRPAIRSCPCPRSLSGSQAGGPCRRGHPCRWPCRQTGGGKRGKNK